VLRAKERALTPYSFAVFSLDSRLNPSRSWERIIMDDIILDSTKTFVVISFIIISIGEVMTIDNTQWFSIHLYVV
jgi:hypothetical protein